MTIDPVQLAHGVTVTVNVPQMPQVCPAPEAPTPGGVTVPVQGGLTAEQFAHIVATVTAKVVEELGGQPGKVSWEAVQGKPAAFPPEAHRHNASDIDDLPSGGGAGIDDATIGTDTTWSSQKIDGKLAGKTDDKFLMMDAETGEMRETGEPLAKGVAMALAYLPYYLMAFNEFANYTMITIVSELPEYTEPGQLYGVRDPATGILAWHMPTILA